MGIVESWFFYFSLLSWPFVSYWFFYKKRQLDEFVLLTVILGYLFLPVYPLDKTWIPPFNLPVLPPLDKHNIPIMTVLIILAFRKGKALHLPKGGVAKALMGLLLVGPIFTILNNAESMHFGKNFIPGLSFTTYPSIVLPLLFDVLAPYVIGYSLLGSDKSHKKIIAFIAFWGLVYSVLMLYEVRMSPQLHAKLYGYFPHDWRQQIREGGFRPVVFLGHGLLVAFFCVLTLFSVRTMWAQKEGHYRKYGGILVLYLAAVLFLCKTYSALAYFLIGFGVLIFLARRLQLLSCVIVAAIVLTYPLTRSYMPIDEISNAVGKVSEDRAGSFLYRIKNEDMLLDKANEKPFFGWGSWGRNLVFDPDSGESLTVPDGVWIIYYGKLGVVGYVGVFGLLAAPLLILLLNERRRRRGSGGLSEYTITLSVMLMVMLIDQIPNSSMNALTFLIAGALLAKARRDSGEPDGASNNVNPPQN